MMARFLLHSFLLTTSMDAIRANINSKWFAGTSKHAGEDCHSVCKALKGVCDINVIWPDDKKTMMAIARDNNILCDIFCHRPDFGNSPVMVPKGQPRQCGDGHAKTNNQQCIYSKPVTGPSTPQRCDRK